MIVVGSRFSGIRTRCCRGSAENAFLGIAEGSFGGVEDGSEGLFFFLTRKIQRYLPGVGSTLCGFFRPGRESPFFLQYSSSEEVKCLSIESESTHTVELDSPSISPAYDELVEVLSRAVSKLNI
jgi:hypothetical protein